MSQRPRQASLFSFFGHHGHAADAAAEPSQSEEGETDKPPDQESSTTNDRHRLPKRKSSEGATDRDKRLEVATFKPDWKLKYPWVRHDSQQNTMLCNPCLNTG
jgi:hypothetical protein